MKSKINNWISSLFAAGGGVFLIDFRDYYKKNLCTLNGVPFILSHSKQILDNTSSSEINDFSSLTNYEFFNKYSPERWFEIDYAVHTFWSLTQEKIIFKPNVLWDDNENLFTPFNGTARAFNRFVNYNTLECIYIMYPGEPMFPSIKSPINNIKELIESVMYYDCYVDEEFFISNDVSIDVRAKLYGILKYVNNNLHSISESTWKENVVQHKKESMSLDLSKDFDIRLFSYNNWINYVKKLSVTENVNKSKQNKGILRSKSL